MDTYDQITLSAPEVYDPALERLVVECAQRVQVSAKHIFSFPGEEMNYIYYIHSGHTKHYMDNSDGSTKMLYTLTRGWFFGETPYFLHTSTGLYSQAESDVLLYRISEAQVERLMAESELFRKKLIEGYSLKMLMLRYEIGNLTFNSCKNRLKKLYCASVDSSHTVDNDWYDLKIRYTHNEMGEIVGGARVTISRQINELCSEGFLRIINRRVQVNIEKYNEYLHG